MEDIGSYNEDTQRARYKAGFKGGPFYDMPNLAPKMTFANGIQPETMKMLLGQEKYPGGITDPWVYRYPNAKMK